MAISVNRAKIIRSRLATTERVIAYHDEIQNFTAADLAELRVIAAEFGVTLVRDDESDMVDATQEVADDDE